MSVEISLDERENVKDIIPVYYGYMECQSGHSYGPAARREYLIHFCLRGKGTLFDKYGEHPVEQGEIFIIRPGEITTYTADEKNPWTYSWIAFKGRTADIFNADSVYKCGRSVGEKIADYAAKGARSPYCFTALVFELIDELFGKIRTTRNVADEIVKYIEFNYNNELSVQKLSRMFGYDRTSLYRIVKNKIGCSPKQYAITLRMEQAKLLLSRGYSVSRAAYAVGYNDEFNFSKEFKKHFGVSPKTVKNGAPKE